MKLDPETTVASLLVAIPSSQVAFDRLAISLDGNQSKTLRQICAEHRIEFDQLVRAINEIDWTAERPLHAAEPRG